MPLALLLTLQAAAAPTPAVPLETDFDLSTYRSSEREPGLAGLRCQAGQGDAITVCGRRPGGAYPLEKMARIYEPGPMDAETTLFGSVRGRAYVESVGMPNGQVSKRVMVGIKVPF